MATHLPNLKDLDLFIDVYTLLKNHELSLNAVARELMKSASTISECISSLESYYHIPLVISKGGVARPTKEADDAVEKFQRIIRLAQTLQEEGQTKTTEIRIATTHSLRHRLLRGSIAAFMWWLKKHCNGIQNTVRVDVQAFDHNEVMHRLAERGVHAYHWGVCWHLPQARFNSYLDFKEIPFPTDELRKARPRTARDKEYVSIKAADCATPVVALTSHLEYGGQAKNLVELFESSSIIERNDILKVLPEARVALLQSEPEDEFRQSIVPLVNASIAVRVHQYEEALHHVQCSDADLAFGPGWYRYRHHIEARFVQIDGKPVMREIRLLHRKPGSGARPDLEMPLADWDEPIKACYVIQRLFLSDVQFAPAIFAGIDTHGGNNNHDRDPIFEAIAPQQIAEWVDTHADLIDKLIRVVK